MPIVISHDLRPMFGTAREQGKRPTCLAFAASDCHAALRDGWTPLSCEFAYFHAQRRAGRTYGQGAILDHLLDVLRTDGQPVKSGWPYIVTANATAATPTQPAGITELFRRNGERRSPAFDDVVSILRNGQPAIVCMMLSDAFYRPAPDGVIVAPAGELADPARRHAVVAVATGSVDKEAAILARNSWGPRWGQEGHAWLPKSYLESRLTRLAVLMEEINVHTS